MTKTISSNDAKQRWGALLGDVSERGDEIIVESHGKPKVVVLSISAYEELQAMREQRRRAEALERIRRLQERVAARNQDVSEEEAIEFAVRLQRELIADMAARGDITFERDLR